jgi:hypothetical protein
MRMVGGGTIAEDDEGLSLERRDLLRLGAGALLGASIGYGKDRAVEFVRERDELEEIEDRAFFPFRLDWRNVGMLPNSFEHFLSGISREDWEYNREHISRKWEVFRDNFPHGEVNAFQKYSPEEGFVSTPQDTVGAGVTQNGRMSSFFSSEGFIPQVPYFSHTGDETQGAKPMEGGFWGLEEGGDLTWLWEDEFDHGITYRDDSSMLDLRYGSDDLAVEETIYVVPGSDTLFRDIELMNMDDEPFDGRLVYHQRSNVTDTDQNFLAWKSNRNRIAALPDGMRWDDLESDYELQARSRPGMDVCKLWGGERTDDADMEGRYLDGDLLFDLELDPDESERVTVALASGRDTDIDESLLEQGQETRQRAVQDWWERWLEDVDDGHVRERWSDMFERSVITLGSMADPDSGILPAAPNVQPMYYPSWIRDGVFMSVALAEAGKPDIARDYLGDFLPGVQEEDGSFKQCYDARGQFTGVIEIANDQPPMYAWGVREVYDRMEGKEADRFLEEAWPAVRDAMEYCLDARVDNGLLAATPDFAEMPTDSRQSLWTNAFAYRGFEDVAYLAEEMGEDGEVYANAAAEMEERIYDEFVEKPDEDYVTYFTVTGGQKNPKGLFTTALWPTEWADDLDIGDDILEEAYRTREEEEPWVPGPLLLARNCAEEGYEDWQEEIVDDLYTEQSAAGNLVEQVEADGGYSFALPLGWSHAAYILAMGEPDADSV